MIKHFSQQIVLKNIKFGQIDYVHTIDEVKQLSAKKKIGFILGPTPLNTVFSIARKNLLLPQKSTYLYPKVLSGLVVRKFEG